MPTKSIRKYLRIHRMRRLDFPQDKLDSYAVLVAVMHQGQFSSKDAKLAKRVRRKLHEQGVRKEEDGRVSYSLAGPTGFALEEAEFEFLKKRLESITDWVPSAVEAVADAIDILEAAKEDA